MLCFKVENVTWIYCGGIYCVIFGGDGWGMACPMAGEVNC